MNEIDESSWVIASMQQPNSSRDVSVWHASYEEYGWTFDLIWPVKWKYSFVYHLKRNEVNGRVNDWRQCQNASLNLDSQHFFVMLDVYYNGFTRPFRCMYILLHLFQVNHCKIENLVISKNNPMQIMRKNGSGVARW